MFAIVIYLNSTYIGENFAVVKYITLFTLPLNYSSIVMGSCIGIFTDSALDLFMHHAYFEVS